MPKYPQYYVRPDGLHESIIRVEVAGKKVRKAFRGSTDKEVYEKIKAFKATEAAAAVSSATFGAVAERWWAELSPTLAHNSLKNYRPAYERAKDAFGKLPIASITTSEIEAYIVSFSKTHAKKTVITQRQIIRQILQAGQRYDLLTFNAAAPVLLPKDLPQKRRHAPPAEQIQLIKASVHEPFGLFCYLIYYTGCRRGEAVGLRYDDIDRERKRIHICRNVFQDGAEAKTKEPKSEAGNRIVPLLSALDAVLPDKFHGYIFSDDGGKTPLNAWTVQHRLDLYRKSTGVNVSPHEIRHGYASALHEAGIDPKTSQTLLGHAQLSTTMDIYTDILDPVAQAAAEAMDASF